MGNWLGNYVGNWLGYWLGSRESEFLCKPTLLVIYDSYQTTIVNELSMTWDDNNFEINTSSCPIE